MESFCYQELRDDVADPGLGIDVCCPELVIRQPRQRKPCKPGSRRLMLIESNSHDWLWLVDGSTYAEGGVTHIVIPAENVAADDTAAGKLEGRKPRGDLARAKT